MKLNESDGSEWVAFKDAFNDAAREHLSMKLDIVKEWISDDTVQLIRKKCMARLQDWVDVYKQFQKLYRTNLRYDRQKWADDKVMEAETALNIGQLKDAFANLQRLRLVMSYRSSPIDSNNDQLTSDQQQEDEARVLEARVLEGILRRTS